MICINFQLHNLYGCSFCTESLKTIAGLSFSKISFKVVSVYILTQSSDMFTKSSDIYAKQKHPGCKKCKANKKQPYLYATKSFDIN